MLCKGEVKTATVIFSVF